MIASVIDMLCAHRFVVFLVVVVDFVVAAVAPSLDLNTIILFLFLLLLARQCQGFVFCACFLVSILSYAYPTRLFVEFSSGTSRCNEEVCLFWRACVCERGLDAALGPKAVCACLCVYGFVCMCV